MDLVSLGFRLDTGEVTKGTSELKKLSREGGNAERSISGITKAVRVAGAALAAAGIAQQFREIAREGERLERNMLRTQAIIRATGGTAGFTANQLRDQARQLALNTLESTEGIMQAQQVLMTFRSVSGDVFARAQEAAMDLATVTGGNLTTAMNQLGRALEQPVEGLTALRRSGVSFTNAQKDLVASLVESGDLLGAQNIILNELATQYGGTAKAEAMGLAGAQDTFAQALQEARIAAYEFLGTGERLTGLYSGLANVLFRLRDFLQAGEIQLYMKYMLDQSVEYARATLNTMMGVYDSMLDGIGAIFNESGDYIEDVLNRGFQNMDAGILFIINAIRDLPENFRTFVELSAIEIATLVEKAKAYGRAIASYLDPRTWFSQDRRDAIDSQLTAQIAALQAARYDSIAAIMEERKARQEAFADVKRQAVERRELFKREAEQAERVAWIPAHIARDIGEVTVTVEKDFEAMANRVGQALHDSMASQDWGGLAQSIGHIFASEIGAQVSQSIASSMAAKGASSFASSIGGAIIGGLAGGAIGAAVNSLFGGSERERQARQQLHDLDMQRLRLIGDEEEIRRRELRQIHERNRALQQAVWALMDVKDANDKLLASAAEAVRDADQATRQAEGTVRAAFQQFETRHHSMVQALLGLISSEEQLEYQRRRELEAMDPLQREYQQTVWRLEDLASAQANYRNELSRLQSEMDRMFTGIRSFVQSIVSGGRGTAAAYQADLELVRSGDTDAMRRIVQTAGAYLESELAGASTFAEYQMAAARVAQELSGLETGLSAEDLLQDISVNTEMSEVGIREQIMELERLYDKQSEAVDSLGLLNGSMSDLTRAILSLEGATSAEAEAREEERTAQEIAKREQAEAEKNARIQANIADLQRERKKNVAAALVSSSPSIRIRARERINEIDAQIARLQSRISVSGSFASGGYTGPGGVNQPAGIVHKGEVVWSQSDVARAGGVAAVEAMRRGMSGYQSGGPVGVTVSSSRRTAADELREMRKENQKMARAQEQIGAEQINISRKVQRILQQWDQNAVPVQEVNP